MESCERVRKKIGEFAAMPVAEIPGSVQGHLAGCPACARSLDAARVSRALLAAAAAAPEPPAGFVERVLAALPVTRARRPDEDLWRLGWRLVPAFAAMLVVLLMLFQDGLAPSLSGPAGPAGLLPSEGLSSGERLVLGTSPAEPEIILAAVLEGGGT